MVKVQCGNCKKVHEVPDSMRGTKARCTACQSVVVIPAAKAAHPIKLKVQCGNCQTVHAVPASMRGQRCKCTTCQAVVVVPGGATPNPTASQGFSSADVGDGLFGELSDADMQGPVYTPSVPSQPTALAPTSSYTGEVDYRQPAAQQNYVDDSPWILRPAILGIAPLRFVEVLVVLMTLVCVPLFTLVTLKASQPYLGGVLFGMFVWIIMVLFYSHSVSETQSPYIRGIIGLIFIVASYEGTPTFYLWVFVYPLLVAGLIFAVGGFPMGAAPAG